jgi:hypothetical protein
MNLIKPQPARRRERDAHGVGRTVSEGGGDDGAGGVRLAPCLDDLGGARRIRAGLNDCNQRETSGVSAKQYSSAPTTWGTRQRGGEKGP